MIERILLPVDGSALSENALAMATQVLTGPRREIELIRVVPSVLQGVVSFAAIGAAPILGPEWDDSQEEQIHDARLYLESVSQRLPRDIHVRTAVRLGDPAGEIVSRAREGAFDLIVMSTHGRTGLGRWVMGSVADAVVHRTALPVLLVHPAADRALVDGEPPPTPLENQGRAR